MFLVKICVFIAVAGGIHASPHPEFDRSLEDVWLTHGSYSSIWCNASGEKPIIYRWFTDDAEEIFFNHSRSLFSNTTREGSFLVFDPVTLPPVNRTHSFTCTATNKHGLRNKIFFVNVMKDTFNETDEPAFDSFYEEVYVAEGTSAFVWCNATGKGHINHSWYRNSTEVEPRHWQRPFDKYVRFEQHGALLVIVRAEFNDTGLYECRASNDYGNATKEYYIQVYENDTRNVTDDDVEFGLVNVTDTSVTLWVTDLNDNDGVVKVNYREVFENINRQKVFFLNYTGSYGINNTNSSILLIQNLIPSGRYTFWLNSNSTNSTSSSNSSSLEVVLLPSPPEVIFRSVGGGQVQIEWRQSNHWADYKRATIDKYLLSYSTANNYFTGWEVNNCSIDISIPFCGPQQYTIANLTPKMYYEIRLQTHTSAGYGHATKHKILMT